MNESFNLYNKKRKNIKEEKDNFLRNYLLNLLIKTLVVIVIFLISMIYIRQSDNNKNKFKSVVYTNSLSFAKIYNLYNKYLGDVIPFKNTKEDETKIVSNEKITYSNIIKENNGYILEISENYAIPALKSGIVIEIKKDKTYNNMITVQDKNNLIITYGYVDDISVKLYDYIEKGEILANASNKLYLIFKKDDKYLSYEEYL